MDRKTVFRASFLTFAAVSLLFLVLAASDFYGSYADIKSIKFLTVEVGNLRLENANNETYLLFDFQISNPVEGRILAVRHESDLFVEGEHIRHKRSDFSPNELIIEPHDAFVRRISMEIPPSKFHLFEKEEIFCRIEASIYVRTPFGQTCISNVHTETLVVTT